MTNYSVKLQMKMNREIPYKDVSDKCKKKYKTSKPYWNQELKDLWVNMHNMEKIFRKCKHVNKNV